ncbi:cysteine desulfurase family protein [Prochlorococcus sp. MIT 1223]|uniref:cysteine desulfurase family protein n=1 Tax=Prochlorococcus sp. MIT 1223 TaxID=3096217 RepID=UPI002A76581F|nr:cysteine desulfurase family protein [Prochlorococcus sp. MIT 1223]
MTNCPLPFDYQSSTPCDLEVIEAMRPYWDEFWGNPSNRQNRLGLHGSAAIGLAREQIASYVNVKPERLIFTSGATEANNLALLGHARSRVIEKGFPGHLITMETEHRAVLDPMRQLEKEGFRLTVLKPNQEGLISLDLLEEAFEEDTVLVSVMLANNEIGVIQPIHEISLLCKQRGIAFHTDAAQGFGYVPLDFVENDIDFCSLSAHKIYGPKGIGGLIIQDGLSIIPLQWGGGQEEGLRPGTLPVPLIVGFAKAVEIAYKNINQNNQSLELLRNHLLCGLKNRLPNLIINGSMEKRLPHNLNISFNGVNGNRLHKELKSFIHCTSGSSCSNGAPSHVLLSLGLNLKETEASLRLSLGRGTRMHDIKKAIEIISKVVNLQRN